MTEAARPRAGDTAVMLADDHVLSAGTLCKVVARWRSVHTITKRLMIDVQAVTDCRRGPVYSAREYAVAVLRSGA